MSALLPRRILYPLPPKLSFYLSVVPSRALIVIALHPCYRYLLHQVKVTFMTCRIDAAPVSVSSRSTYGRRCVPIQQSHDGSMSGRHHGQPMRRWVSADVLLPERFDMHTSQQHRSSDYDMLSVRIRLLKDRIDSLQHDATECSAFPCQHDTYSQHHRETTYLR